MFKRIPSHLLPRPKAHLLPVYPLVSSLTADHCPPITFRRLQCPASGTHNQVADTLSSLRTGDYAGRTHLKLREDLREFPREIFDLADTLEILDLSDNELTDLPADLSRLHRLRILFCSGNPIVRLPEVLGQCPQLRMIGFRGCQLTEVPAASLPPFLRWLILTDNKLTSLPAALGRCTALEKCMLSGNQLASLPEEMAACENLALLRLASNHFESLPEWLFRLPSLCWLAFSGNPLSPVPAHHRPLPQIPWTSLRQEAVLGSGASGVIHRASWHESHPQMPPQVAVKVFKGAMTSDGLPASEMAASIAVGTHPNLVEILGELTAHPEGNAGLALRLIDPSFSNLAGPPSFDTCSRDVYAEDARFALPAVVRMARGIASAAAQLHARGIMHGDLYAHNIMWQEDGACLLGDFGGASFYPAAGKLPERALERLDVRAFGLLLEELLTRCPASGTDQSLVPDLWRLQRACVAPDPSARPAFAELTQSFASLD